MRHSIIKLDSGTIVSNEKGRLFIKQREGLNHNNNKIVRGQTYIWILLLVVKLVMDVWSVLVFALFGT